MELIIETLTLDIARQPGIQYLHDNFKAGLIDNHPN